MEIRVPSSDSKQRRKKMSNLGIVVLILLVFMALGGLPKWGYHNYGYAPSGLLGVILVIVLILAVLGRL
jgi:uncharacterized membrane protein